MTVTAHATGATASTGRRSDGVRWEHANWLAAAIPLVVAWWVFRRSGVESRDLAAFAAYVVVVLTLPGTVVWTLVRGRVAPTVPRWVDLAFGTVVGLLLEAPLYLLCRHLGEPRLLWAWPGLVVALLAARVARRRDHPRRWLAGLRRPPLPPFHAWVLSLLMVYALLSTDLSVLGPTTLRSSTLRAPDVDLPFHLALIGDLRYHVPAEMPFVAGTPLKYHWLVYAHTASASWLTGMAPVVLLKTVTPALLIVCSLLGAAAGAVLLSRRTWAGTAAAVALVLVSTLDVWGWSPTVSPWAGLGAFNPRLFYLSPTYAYSATLFVVPLVTALLWLRAESTSRVEAAGRSWRGGWNRNRTWSDWALPVLFAVSIVPVGGAKSTTLPVLGAGLLGATVLQWVLRRRPPTRLLVLLVITGIGFLVDKAVFYGPGARSLTWAPLDLFRMQAVTAGLAPDRASVPTGYLLAVGAAWLLARLAVGAGAVGLLVRGGWRDQATQLLLAMSAAGLGATMLLGHFALGQAYFAQAVRIPLTLASVLGILRLVRERDRAAALAATTAVAAGMLVGALVPTAFNQRFTLTNYSSAIVLPLAVTGVAVSLALLVGRALARRAGIVGVPLVLVGALMVMALGSTSAIAITGEILTARRDKPLPAVTSIRPGGLVAASWLRRHSGPDDLVATNAHCRLVLRPGCDRRHFWISGFTERRVLVEGWAYVSPQTVGLPSNRRTNSYSPPFWDLARLKANDRAFSDPTAASTGVLARRYGVTWLFVDERFPHDRRALDRVTDRAFHAGDYTVYRLRR